MMPLKPRMCPQKPEASSARSAGEAFFGQAAPAQPDGPVVNTSSRGPARSPGQPFFGQAGPAQPEGPVIDISSSSPARSPGKPFFSDAGADDRASQPPPPPNQQAQKAQAAARNRAQGPSQKTPDAKPTFQVIGMFLASPDLLPGQQAVQQACKLTLAAAAPSALATWRLCSAVLRYALSWHGSKHSCCQRHQVASGLS